MMLTRHQLLQNPAAAISRLQLLIVWTGCPKDSIKKCALDALGPLLESLGARMRHGGALNDFSILENTSPPHPPSGVGSSVDHRHCPEKSYMLTSWINAKNSLENSLFLILLGPQALSATFRQGMV